MGSTLLHMIALSKVPMVGPILGRILVSYCGGPEEVFRAQIKDVARIPQIGPVIAKNIHQASYLLEAEDEISRMQKEGITGTTYLDSTYPSRLKYFEESPLVLYSLGEPDLHHFRTVGIVGTRRPTPFGRLFTEMLVEKLQPFGALIVSGMAHGIDGFAHHAALQHGMPTIGVLGHGFHTLYPPAHFSLAQRMRGTSGLLTEFPWAAKPDKENFPMRNRVIAALSDALVVVESKEKGGSMITAEFANRFNKDVFAMPGSVQEPYSKGCNLLIKRNKAHLIEDAIDITEIMGWEPVDKLRSKAAQKDLFPELDPTEKDLVNLLKGQAEMLIDDLGFHLNLTPGSVSALLLGMEFKGLVHQLPGKRYMLCPGF